MQMKFFRKMFRTFVVISGLLTSPSLYAELAADPGTTPTANIGPVGSAPKLNTSTLPEPTSPAATPAPAGTDAPVAKATPAVTPSGEKGSGLKGDKQALHQALKTFRDDAKNVSLDKKLLRDTEKRFGKDSTQVQTAKAVLTTDLATRKKDLKTVATDLKQVHADQKADKPKMKSLDQALKAHHEGKGHHEMVRVVRIVILEHEHSRHHEQRREHEHRREREHEHSRPAAHLARR